MLNINPSFIKKIFLSLILGLKYEKKIEDAYKILKEKNKLTEIDKIKFEIENTKIKFNRNKPSIHLKLNKEIKDINDTLNQIIYHKYINTTFTSKIGQCLAFNKVFYYPLPDEWIKVVKDKGIKTNFFFSKLLFNFTIVFFFFKKFFSLLKFFFLSKKIINYNQTTIYLDSVGNIDLNSNEENFLLWCKKFLKLNTKIIFIHNNNKISDINKKDFELVYTEKFYFNFTTFKERLIYLGLLFKCLIQLIVHAFKGNQKDLLLIEEMITYVFLNNFNYKIPEYAFFNNSNCMIKPLWVSFLENKEEKKVFMYFYSTNHFPIDTYNKGLDGYRLMSWHNYIFWINEQADWLRKINQDFKSIDIVDYFPFTGKYISILKKKKTISIFPVTPFQDKYIFEYMPGNHYYNLDNSINFLNHILNCIKNDEVQIIIKLKRDNPHMHDEYKKFIDNLKKDEKINLIDPNISAKSIVVKSDLVISSPYTSTSLIANHYKIPTIFYDSSSGLTQEEPCVKKVQLLKSEMELFKWIKKVLEKK